MKARFDFGNFFGGDPESDAHDGKDVAQRQHKLPLSKLVPNILTLLAMSSGLTGVRFAMESQFQQAEIAILVAGIFDMLDGRVARLLHSTSKFGAELDSLADVISFGVCPALIMYLFSLHEAGGFGWACALGFAVCCAMRLARFNTMLEKPEDETRAWTKGYFVGVPAPGGAGLGMLPLTLTLQYHFLAYIHGVVLALWMAFVGILMISRVPTFATKGIRIPVPFVMPVVILIAVAAMGLFTNTWLTLSAVGIAYLISIPFSWRNYRRREKLSRAMTPASSGVATKPEDAVEA